MDNVNRRLTLLDPLDRGVLLASLVLVLLLGLTVARGDQIGLQVNSRSPQESGSIRAAVSVAFDEPIEASASSFFQISPKVPGTVTTSGRNLTFQPDNPWQVGARYAITIAAGVTASQTMRTLKAAVQWSFTVRSPRIAYLQADPANPVLENIYMVDLATPANPIALTNSQVGIGSFDVSPDGMRIVYSEFNESTRGINLLLWEAATGASSLLLNCDTSACGNPKWSPRGDLIAFERSEGASSASGNGISRIWLLPLATRQPRPLFSDSQIIGYGVKWSPDGKRIGVFSQSPSGNVTLIKTLETDEVKQIPTEATTSLEFSPDSQSLLLPKVVEVPATETTGRRYATRFSSIDLTSPYLTQRDTAKLSDPGNDQEAIWAADGQSIYVTRRPPYSGTQSGLVGTQIMQIDLATLTATEVLPDQETFNSEMVLSPLADKLIMRRFTLGKTGGRPELWVMDLATKQLTKLAQPARAAVWMP